MDLVIGSPGTFYIRSLVETEARLWLRHEWKVRKWERREAEVRADVKYKGQMFK